MTDPAERTRFRIVQAAAARPWLAVGAVAATIAVVGALVVISGIVSIKASSGHLSVTANLLDFAKFRSVATYASAVESPSLDDETLVIRGARHYERACAPCHGGPGIEVPAVMAAMTPPPPRLPDALGPYNPEKLFVVVKDGIKFTGMPAWPAQQRADEVWAVVAFLRRLPRLSDVDYRRLAAGEPVGASDDLPPVIAENCAQCHGVDGLGDGRGAFPAIAGQRADYLYESMLAFANRSRFSGIMTSAVADLPAESLRAAAEYYAGRRPRAAGSSEDFSAIERGAAIARRGIPEEDIPACAECHGPSDRPKDPAYPTLAGQYPAYIASQLRLLKERRRGGTPRVTLMLTFVDRLTLTHIRDVSLYYASLSPAPQTEHTVAAAR